MAVDVTGKTVVLTGTLSSMTRKQATAQLEAIGAVVASSVTAKTDILFAGPGAGSKLDAAEKHGIPVFDEAELLAVLGDERSVPAPAAVKSDGPAAPVQQEIEDGEVVYVQGSGSKPYELKNTGGVYSCSCPAWRNQSNPIERRTCKHLKQIRGLEAEVERVGADSTSTRAPAASGVTTTTSKPALLLAQKWEPHVDPKGWWMSEKLDGVRAYWDGSTFISRLGNEFLAPDWFVADLPKTPLDGELWMDRGAFQRTVSVVRRQDRSKQWENLRYVIFDAPDHGGAFEDRLDFLHGTFGEGTLEFAHALPHDQCEGFDHLAEELARIEALGGEGVMLREAKSKYVGNRSTSLLKVKSFFDAEAKVVGYTAGAGRHKGRVGALELIAPDGTRFSCGTGLSDAERDNPPEIGTIVTYRYQELTDGGVPRFPSYVGVRADAEWPTDGVSIAVKTDTVPAGPSTPPPAEPAAGPTGATRRFEFVEGNSSKFWEVSVAGNTHTVCYGRIGTSGASKEKTFPDADAAQADAEKLIREKVRKGYEEV